LPCLLAHAFTFSPPSCRPSLPCKQTATTLIAGCLLAHSCFPPCHHPAAGPVYPANKLQHLNCQLFARSFLLSTLSTPSCRPSLPHAASTPSATAAVGWLRVDWWLSFDTAAAAAVLHFWSCHSWAELLPADVPKCRLWSGGWGGGWGKGQRLEGVCGQRALCPSQRVRGLCYGMPGPLGQQAGEGRE